VSVDDVWPLRAPAGTRQFPLPWWFAPSTTSTSTDHARTGTVIEGGIHEPFESRYRRRDPGDPGFRDDDVR
jgi:hypothetical protein